MKKIREPKDRKVDATAIIWGCATGMMAICIPLVSASGTGAILPLSIIFGASVSTVSVWHGDKQNYLKSSNNFQQIEQRVRDLETICCSEDFKILKKTD